MSNFTGGFLKKINILFTLLLLTIIAMIIISPLKFITAGMNGISAWTFNVLPSVLPFIILTKMLSNLGVIEKLCHPFKPIFHRLYGTSSLSAYVFFMSILSGYPVGSKIIADLYEENKISRTDAYRMSSFCSNSGPMFIVGSVGTMMFLSPKAGYIILASHILAALLNGLLYRNIKAKEDPNSLKNPTNTVSHEINIGDIILSSVEAILSVGAIICLFFIIIECLNPIFNLFPSPIKEVFKGMIEITRGCIDLSKYGNLKLMTILSSFIITFGGFSTIVQSIAILKRVKMPIKIFTLQKLTQSIISILICTILVYTFL